MKPNKTQPNNNPVDAYIASIEDEQKRADAVSLVKLLSTATHTKPIMWGPSIVGFGTYHYVYDSGREGDTPAVGFSARKQALTLYGLFHYDENKQNIDLAKQLGTHTHGKGCLYIKRLSDVDLDILAKMITNAYMQRANTP